MPDEPLAAVVPSENATLEYRPCGRDRTRWGRLAVFVMVAVILAALMPRMWTEFGHRVGRRDFERSLLTFTAAPGTLAYGEGADAVTVGADAVGSWTSSQSPWQPSSARRNGRSRNAPTWQAWFSLSDYAINRETTLFLHERASPNGTRRLVAVSCETLPDPFAPSGHARAMSFRVATAMPATMLMSSKVRAVPSSTWRMLGHWPDVRTPVSFLVGQPDPKDTSRFTIDYAFGGDHGTLVGQLCDDDTVNFTAKDGPLATTATTNPSK